MDAEAPHPPVAPVVRSLADLPVGGRGVVAVVDEAGALSRRLLEIGFFPGAYVEVIAAQWPGDDPMAVRVGGSTFALRRREAQRVRVSPLRTVAVAP